MRFSTSIALGLLVGLSDALAARQDNDAPTTLPNGSATSLSTIPSRNTAVAIEQLEQLADFAYAEAIKLLEEGTNRKRRPHRPGTCSRRNLAIRREWGALSNPERKAYTDAVLCLQEKQARTPSYLIPGARSRFDDWIGTHINQTATIHYTGTFLAWHRYFTWQYEQALRNECGYKGYQPYWDWAKTAITGLEKSVMLDGSAYSMSGNGKFIPGKGNITISGNGLPDVTIPSGTGGGCVNSGPFKDMKVNLGPVALGLSNGSTISNGDGLSYNPRCLKRDLTDYANKRFANASSFIDLLKTRDIMDFQMTMQGYPGSGDIGVHGGGHYSMGGDPGRDLFTSPGDPLFYLHHGGIDRAWWIWQSRNKRTSYGAKGIAGTGTFLNQMPSPNTTLDTMIDFGYAAGPPRKMRELMSTTGGPFCYIYK
ncbi:hypothetical protein BDV95DRAFT_630919 [Massariosphaeria phaeospora]|uniref:Tyrosinase copper-binding domain-containing protein n=1 Tax=Massariosphaeria phaeospora TaxID=100035 RepID=A0A7C8MA78_9PLEO|nr:hypothetical protein BDV95DRAFT_630919 [Massariosphaeria phaeospora]